MNHMVVATIIGVFLIIFFIILKYLKSKCNTEIEAIYIKSNDYWSVHVTQYAPVFKYNFNGVEYEKQTFQAFPKKHIKDLVVGEKYNILIDERKPTRFVINKKVKNGEIVILLTGIFLTVAGIISIFNMYN